MHYGGHLRAVFCDWVDHGCEAEVFPETGDMPDVISREQFLTLMSRCSDAMPDSAYANLEWFFANSDEEQPWSTYGSVSRFLLRFFARNPEIV
jgi:hypothetical protein